MAEGLEIELKIRPKTPFFKKSLPLFITKENKGRSGIVLSFLASFLYLSSNHLHFFVPKLLPLSSMDQMIPFLPHTVWIYASEYLFFIVIYVSCQNLINLNRYTYSFLSLQTVSVIIFWIWPTAYPRDLFPLSSQLDPLTHLLFS